MKPLATQTRGDVLKKMFPYSMKFYYVATYIDDDTWGAEEQKEETLLGEYPCSVQTATSSNGGILENEYIILSPCLDLKPKESSLPSVTYSYYRIEVSMNEKTNTAENTDILSIDNLEVYKIGDYSIGCKIRVHINSGTWAW